MQHSYYVFFSAIQRDTGPLLETMSDQAMNPSFQKTVHELVLHGFSLAIASLENYIAHLFQMKPLSIALLLNISQWQGQKN